MTRPVPTPAQVPLPLALAPCPRRDRTGRMCTPFVGADGRERCTDCGEGWT